MQKRTLGSGGLDEVSTYRQPDHIRSSTPYIQVQGTRQEY